MESLSGHQVVHVEQDLETDLEALFNSVMNPKPSSWRNKMLPESFFKEPDLGTHSRQSSTDSGSLHTPRLTGTVQHARSHSSPASLQFGTGASATPKQAHLHAHLRQQSFDVADELPLPPGWEMAFTSTGQRYFLNHLEKITTWQDPRKTMTAGMTQMDLHSPAPSSLGQQCSMAQTNLVMLHHHQHHPQHQQHQHQQQPHPQHQHHQQHQQQQATQAQAMVPGPQVPQQQGALVGLLSLPNPLTSQQQHQQKMRLQRIQLERDRIRSRQEELMRQEVALYRRMPNDPENMAGGPTPVNTAPLTQGTNHNSDPFLNSGPYHSREQSSDSGLGLGCHSVPTTPEDILNSAEEMDTGEGLAPGSLGVPHQSRFPDFLDSLPGTNVDLGTLEGADLIPILNDVESVLNKAEPYLTWL